MFLSFSSIGDVNGYVGKVPFVCISKCSINECLFQE